MSAIGRARGRPGRHRTPKEFSTRTKPKTLLESEGVICFRTDLHVLLDKRLAAMVSSCWWRTMVVLVSLHIPCTDSRCYGRETHPDGTCLPIKDAMFQIRGVTVMDPFDAAHISFRNRRQLARTQNALRGNARPRNRGRPRPGALPNALPQANYDQSAAPGYGPANGPPQYLQQPQSAQGPQYAVAPSQTPLQAPPPGTQTQVAPLRPRNRQHYVVEGQAPPPQSTTTAKPKGSQWGHNIHLKQGGSFRDAPNAKYYYPPKMRLPLNSCFYNPSGYVCCNLHLNNLMVDTVMELKKDPKFNTCNIGAISNAVQRRAEEMFGTPFEAITALEDFAQTIHFSGDLVCKVEIDGKVIMTYGTPYNANAAQDPVSVEQLPSVVDDAVVMPGTTSQLRSRRQVTRALI